MTECVGWVDTEDDRPSVGSPVFRAQRCRVPTFPSPQCVDRALWRVDGSKPKIGQGLHSSERVHYWPVRGVSSWNYSTDESHGDGESQGTEDHGEVELEGKANMREGVPIHG